MEILIVVIISFSITLNVIMIIQVLKNQSFIAERIKELKN